MTTRRKHPTFPDRVETCGCIRYGGVTFIWCGTLPTQRNRAQEARDGAYYVRLFMARDIKVPPADLSTMAGDLRRFRASRDRRSDHATIGA